MKTQINCLFLFSIPKISNEDKCPQSPIFILRQKHVSNNLHYKPYNCQDLNTFLSKKDWSRGVRSLAHNTGPYPHTTALNLKVTVPIILLFCPSQGSLTQLTIISAIILITESYSYESVYLASLNEWKLYAANKQPKYIARVWIISLIFETLNYVYEINLR